MNYILNIHTSSEKAIVNICDGDKVLSTVSNTEQNQHAAFLHVAIKNLLQKSNIKLSKLKAIGVTGGPGSYTGIRVGLATAKGLCFGLKIPMMMFNSLELMAFSAIKESRNPEKDTLFCPMIDARRMEVFTAVYNMDLKEIIEPAAQVLEENSFSQLIQKNPFIFFGSGAEKFEKLISTIENLRYILSEISTEALAIFSWNQFQKKNFENLLNSHPMYIKDFYTTAKIN
ncbi:MAG: tRNA (adenosine(37)-N6)-threonylcarbamoyltransferase complex dimerization subunit type 1 TsaB [Ginsengibacter sp.]